MGLTTKTIRIDDDVLDKIDLVVKGLNIKAGVNVYDFSSVVRLAFNEFLNTNEMKEIISLYKKTNIENSNDLLVASESSLAKDWLSEEEDKAWVDL